LDLGISGDDVGSGVFFRFIGQLSQSAIILVQDFFSETRPNRVCRALEWLSSISVAKIMDEKQKFVKFSAPTSPDLGWITPLF